MNCKEIKNIKIQKEKLTKENLYKIMLIDHAAYKDIKKNINFYFERYNENHEGIFLYYKNKLIGYIISVPVKEELYNALINCVMINDLEINPRMYINESNYNYIVSVAILKKYREKGLGSKMAKFFFENATKGKYCTLTISNQGNYLAKSTMKLVNQINDNVSIYEFEKNKCEVIIYE